MAVATRKGFSANLGMLFKESGSLLNRFQHARKAGFDSVEISTPELYDFSPQEVATAMNGEGLKCVLLNMPAGKWANGDRGLAALPHRQIEFDRSVDMTLEYAALLKCTKVHCLAGIAPLDIVSRDTYKKNIIGAAHILGIAGVDVLIEPINQRSIPGYHLRSMKQAAEVIAAFNSKTSMDSFRDPENEGCLKLLFDVFHCQIMHGDITTYLRRYHEIVGHVQIAGVPERNEPDSMQEVNFPYLFQLLREELNYTGHIGCEYHPRGDTERGLSWMQGGRRFDIRRLRAARLARPWMQEFASE